MHKLELRKVPPQTEAVSRVQSVSARLITPWRASQPIPQRPGAGRASTRRGTVSLRCIICVCVMTRLMNGCGRLCRSLLRPATVTLKMILLESSYIPIE